MSIEVTQTSTSVASRSPLFRINARLDIDLLAHTLRANRRVHIAPVLDAHGAGVIHDHLAQDVKWGLDLKANSWRRELPANELAELDAAQMAEMLSVAHSAADGGHAHIYEACPVSTDAVARSKDLSLLARFVDFLNSGPFLDFARKISGIPGLRMTDARAMRYRWGHFISVHNDGGVPGRRIAYVFSFTPKWRADWGGLLEFRGSTSEIEEAYEPRFNALNLFLVPQLHSVSAIAPFADTSGRLSVSGWLYDSG